MTSSVTQSCFLPPAYVVRREGNVLTRVCPSIHLSVHRGGYPYPIMLCNISQNAMGQRGGYLTGYPPGGVPDRVPPGGVPDRVPPGGYLTGYPRGGTWGYLGGGTWSGTPPGGWYLTRYVPDRVPPPGGVPDWGGTLVRYPPGQVRMGGVPCWGWGGTQVGQQKEYSLHGGRYASCVHAGELSCSK